MAKMTEAERKRARWMIQRKVEAIMAGKPEPTNAQLRQRWQGHHSPSRRVVNRDIPGTNAPVQILCRECGERVMTGTRCWETGMMHTRADGERSR